MDTSFLLQGAIAIQDIFQNDFSLKYYENSVAHNVFHCCAVTLTLSYPVPNFKWIGKMKCVLWKNEIPWDLKLRWVSWDVWGGKVGGVGWSYITSAPCKVRICLRRTLIQDDSIYRICLWYSVIQLQPCYISATRMFISRAWCRLRCPRCISMGDAHGLRQATGI